MITPDECTATLRTDFMSFIERAFDELNPKTPLFAAGYIDKIAERLEACRQGEVKRLIINLPPRHLKSHCASIAFVAWWLGHQPALQVICASYGQDLSDKLARDCRKIMESHWYKALFPTRLAQRQVGDFITTESGTRLATSVGGVLTGRGADVIIIDDPLKPDEALSETRRNAVNEWYDHSLLSRLNDKENGCIIILMQRLHQDDLVGHVLEHGGWEMLSFPAIAEADECYEVRSEGGITTVERKAGEALLPERESLETLGIISRTIGTYAFASQYQQCPMPVGGAMIQSDWLRYYAPGDLPERFSSILHSWDTANKSTELHDFSVCTTWGVWKDRFYLLDVVRKRLQYPNLKRAVVAQAGKYSSSTTLIEDKASGTALIQDLRGDGLRVKEYLPPTGTDKILRLHAQTIAFESGRVWLPQAAPWLGEYVRELTGFPGARFDDQVDSTTQALDYLRTTGRKIAIWESLA